MEQYEEWPEEDQDFSENYPIQNIINLEAQNQNQFQYRINQFMPSNNIQERNNSQNPFYNINNQINNNYNYNQRLYYKSQNRDINKSSHNNNYDKFTKYESSDGVLRGYTNNFSFYESNSSKIKPKEINNNSNQYNNINNLKANSIQYNYQKTNIPQDIKRKYQNNINTNVNNRQIINTNKNNNSSYIIRVIEDEPVEYISPNQQYHNNNNDMNYINNNNEKDYYYNENEIENRYELQNLGQPTIQRRMIKGFIQEQPNSQREDYYNIEPQNNLRNYNINQNIYRNDIEQSNNYNRKFYSNDVNQIYNINSDQLLRKNNAPRTQYSNYALPMKQRKYIDPYYSESNIINEPYNAKYPYKTFTEQNNNYIVIRADNNFPKNRSPFLGHSPNINRNNEYVLQNQFNQKQREYTSRTEQNQTGYEFEYEEDDDVYEAPDQYQNNAINNNFINNRDYREEKRQNNISERPFARVNNYSQAVRNGKKYGAYTQALEMNRNYYSNNNDENDEEYEYEVPDNSRNNRIKENCTQPKIMRPINDVQRLLKNKREYSAFEKSLKNIRNNEEEIELENEARNNRIRLKENGENNIGFISNNNGPSSREYQTFTEQQDNRTQEQGYILQDLDDSNFENYETYQNQSNRNIENNLIERNKIQKQYIQGKNYLEKDQMENMQDYDEQEVEEDDDNEGAEQMYDSSQLITAKEDNFGIVQNNIENENINDEEVDQAQIQMNEGEVEENRITENEGIYRREKMPEYRNEKLLPNGKNLKNIETEICEKYYDNQGNYLGEKKIITTNPIPREDFLQQGEEYYEEQEEIEENENEYMPYQSSNKKFKKRGKNIVKGGGPTADNDMSKNQNLKMNMNKESTSKYHSYYGDDNNNIYHEIKKIEENSNNEKEIGNKTYKQPITLVKNITFGIHSENLCVPADDNETDNNNNRESEKQRNTKSSKNNDEKEADEQQIEENEENAVIEEDEDQNQVTLNQNDGNYNLPIEQNADEPINGNDNDHNGESENINDNKNIESQNSEQNYNYNYTEENNLDNDDENNYQNYEEKDNHYDENINNNEEKLNMNDKNGGHNIEYENENENEEERIYEENEAEEIENQNIQKDEVEEEDIGEGLVDIEHDNNYNYQQDQENDYEENQKYDEEGEEMEQREEYNIIEEDNKNKEEVRDNNEEN